MYSTLAIVFNHVDYPPQLSTVFPATILTITTVGHHTAIDDR